MESRISEILNRMNEENRKLNHLKNEYFKCEKLQKSDRMTLSASVLIEENSYWATASYDIVQVTLEGDALLKVINLLKDHYNELGFQCKKNLEDMVEEMKTPH